ncbi:hypothetical protein D3C87_1014840 [compost metagenome]
MIRGSRCVPPKPGTRPRLISGWPNLALSEAIRIWAAMASSLPPPRQKPLMAAITGFFMFSMRVKTTCPRAASCSASLPGAISAISLMSAPAMKAMVPPPVRTRALMVSSASSSSMTSLSSMITLELRALAGGLSTVTMATASSRSTLMNWRALAPSSWTSCVWKPWPDFAPSLPSATMRLSRGAGVKRSPSLEA